ncbi:hypothetical protein F5X99DRAFT_422182 [Biscogniauxia marginata]|nr:hypothetical protein F5X99DRAFT_422182 [Biscogniauxia marginata]
MCIGDKNNYNDPAPKPAQIPQYSPSSSKLPARASMPPSHNYAAPAGLPPSKNNPFTNNSNNNNDAFAPPPGPPPPPFDAAAAWDPQGKQKQHDWESAVPDTALLPPPPNFFSGFDRSPANNATEEEAEAGEAWCREYPLYAPLTLDAGALAALASGNINMFAPPSFRGALARTEPGVWRGSTPPGTPDTYLATYPPLYSVTAHSPLATGRPKTAYFEVRILEDERRRFGGSKAEEEEVTLALGFAAPPYPAFRLPGWHRASVGVHGDDGHNGAGGTCTRRRTASRTCRSRGSRAPTTSRRKPRLMRGVKVTEALFYADRTLTDYTETNRPSVRSTSPLPIRLEPANANRASDPLGLTVLHAPTTAPSADIIFLHGLGGSSRLTWCKDRNLNLFWPREWLPADPDIRHARILSFGYNANFRSSAQSSSLSISDFSKNLLYDMLFSTDPDGNPLRLGEAPIIFVAHSMGGLVFKQAYLDARLDDRYASLINSIKAVIFLSTPHRGSDLAKPLNKILSASFGLTPKNYVSELIQNGPFLRTINEQFRHLAPSLQIFSFYETLRTSLGISSSLILDSETAKLGYPGEISRSLNADHHNVCKFESPRDPNYQVVLGALKSLIPSCSSQNPQPISQETKALRDTLSIAASTEHDLDLFSSRRADGTCQWVLTNPSIHEWASSPSKSSLVWLHGRPARGKSILSSYLVQNLQERGAAVQYFFFRAGDETKRSIAALLRVLAFQAAMQIAPFRKALIALADGGYKPKDTDWRSTWKRLFTNLLFEMDSCPPLYWVIDGLDEAGSQHHLFELLPDINNSRVPVRVLVTSRWSRDLSSAFERIGPKISCYSALCIDHGSTDIRIYVEDELKYCSWSDEITSEIMEKILQGAQGNFLWVHLMLQEVKDCHTEDDVRHRLSELPPGMDGIYRRMEKTISQIRRESDRNLSRTLLTWAIHARRPLTVEELSDILEPEFGRLLNISHTANQLCGQFIVVEGNERIGLIHQTAREYLSTTSAHADLFRQCITSFMDKGLRSKLQKIPAKSFSYRATSWAYHLAAAEVEDMDFQLELLATFLSHTSLRVLIEASESLYSFMRRKQKIYSARGPSIRWSRDLLKLLGKFGSCLSQDPASIYTCIASFCPTSSAIHRNFGQISSVPLEIHGRSDVWDDCLARVSVGSENVADLICCSGRYLVVVNSVGTTVIWDCTTFHQVGALDHGEHVSSVCFSVNGDRLATYGFRTTKVWIPQTDTRSMCLQFINDDSGLIMGAEPEEKSWAIIDATLLNDVESREGTYLNSPTILSISPDGSRIAATYRSFPLDIWSIDPPTILKRVWRRQKPGQVSAPLPFVSKVSWHPSGDELLGIFLDGCIFKVNLVDDTIQERPPDLGQMSSDILCSPDGLVYAVRGVQGTVKIFDYQSSILIYQLSSEDIISAFCFSHDGRRFCDIRGAYCTVWEPNALMRLSTIDDTLDSLATDKSLENHHLAFESFTDNAVRIMLMSPKPNGSLACLGDDDGAVELIDFTTSEKIPVDQVANRLSIEHVAWSDDGSHFCYAEISGRLTLVQVDHLGDSWKPRRVERFKPKLGQGGITQLIFFSGNKSILVASQLCSQIWSLEPSKLETIYTNDTPLHSPKWMVHPQSPDYLLSVTPSGVSVHSQIDLEKISTWYWGEPVPLKKNQHAITYETNNSAGKPSSATFNASPVVEEVERVYKTFFHAYAIVKISRQTRSRPLRPRFVIFDGAAINVGEGVETGELNPISIPQQVEETIEMPLNILSNGVLVFLDRTFWVCSWNLRSTRGDGVKRHFFIPRDWLPVQSLGLLHITASGTILCARNGGISTINTSIGLMW